MSIQIGAPPDAGFDQPLRMLRDCHRRVERFLSILVHVAREAAGLTLSDAQRTAVESALHYFSHAGQLHNQDEELSLFARVSSRLDAATRDQIATLESEHAEADLLFARVDQLYREWIEKLILAPSAERALLAATTRLESIYSHHIRIEEDLVFPAAELALNDSELALIGQEFRARRGLVGALI